MKPVWISLTCFTALGTGVLLGRHAAVPASSGSLPAGAARPAGLGAAATPQPVPDLLTYLKQTSGIRKKTTLMLKHLAKGQPGNISQLVEAAGNDASQLLMLSDIALHTDPAGFVIALFKNAGTEGPQDVVARNFAEKWAKTDFNAAFQTCRALPSPIGSWVGGVVLETRMATDPTAALKLAVAHPELRFNWNNDHKIPATLENVELVRALPPSMGKFAMIKALSASMPVDQALAMVYEDRQANPLYGAFRVSEAIVEKDPTAAQQWVIANPDHPARSQMARRFGDHLIKTNPTAAVDWATNHISGTSRTRALEKAAAALQKTDPAAAAAARALLPEAFKAAGKP